MTDFDWSKKLTQKDLDEMALEALGETETKGKPDIIARLKEEAAKRRGEGVTTA